MLNSILEDDDHDVCMLEGNNSRIVLNQEKNMFNNRAVLFHCIHINFKKSIVLYFATPTSNTPKRTPHLFHVLTTFDLSATGLVHFKLP